MGGEKMCFVLPLGYMGGVSEFIQPLLMMLTSLPRDTARFMAVMLTGGK